MPNLDAFCTKVIYPLLRTFFSLLYHQFAWTYDLVAATVSIGRWKKWIFSVTPYLTGTHILEIGHGPGHLILKLNQASKTIIGLDTSPQMGRITRQRLLRHKITPCLIRGKAQKLPFRSNSLDHVISTFPAEYIFDIETLNEAYRVIKPQGTLIILPYAWITGGNCFDKIAAWIFKVTGEAPRDNNGHLQALDNTGFLAVSEKVPLDSSVVQIIRAQKPQN